MIWTSVQRELRLFMWISGRTEGRTDSQANFHDENGGNLNAHNNKICGLVCGIVFIVRFFLLIWEVIAVFGAFFLIPLRKMPRQCPTIRPHSILSHTFLLFTNHSVLQRYVNWTTEQPKQYWRSLLGPCFKARKWNMRVNLSTTKQAQAEGYNNFSAFHGVFFIKWLSSGLWQRLVLKLSTGVSGKHTSIFGFKEMLPDKSLGDLGMQPDKHFL